MPQAQLSTFAFPTRILFGWGASEQLPLELKRHARRPLFVTDKGLAQLPVFQNLVEKVKEAKFFPTVFSGVDGNPILDQVLEGLRSYQESQSDSIVGVGGGAALDVAKAIALLVNHDGHLFDYEDGKADALPISDRIPYLLAIPTTAGTGSEVGRSTVISDPVTKIKKIVFSPYLLPKCVIADPQLTADLPAKITAATGMDALTHLLESYLVDAFHPICDGIALEGLRLVGKSLVSCVQMEAEHRADMLAAAMMGAIAFQKGLGVAHSMAHALSTVCNLHHGLANGIVLPYAMVFNVDACPEKFKIIAQLLDLNPQSGQAVVDWIFALQKKISIPSRLSEVGVTFEQLPRLVEVAVNDVCHQSNPRRVSQADFVELFSQAI